jgi:hypothetical protein
MRLVPFRGSMLILHMIFTYLHDCFLCWLHIWYGLTPTRWCFCEQGNSDDLHIGFFHTILYFWRDVNFRYLLNESLPSDSFVVHLIFIWVFHTLLYFWFSASMYTVLITLLNPIFDYMFIHIIIVTWYIYSLLLLLQFGQCKLFTRHM